MKYIIRLTESEFYRMVGDIATRLLSEDVQPRQRRNDGVSRLLNDLGFGDLLGENRIIKEAEDNSFTDNGFERATGVGRKRKEAPMDKDKVVRNIENNMDVDAKSSLKTNKPKTKKLRLSRPDLGGVDPTALNRVVVPGTKIPGEEDDTVLVVNGEDDLKNANLPPKLKKKVQNQINKQWGNVYDKNISADDERQGGKIEHDRGVKVSMDTTPNQYLQGQIQSQAQPTVDYVNSEEFREMLYNLIHLQLNGDDRAVNVLESFYGGETPEEIGKRYGIGSQMVRLIIRKSLDALRNSPEFKTRIQELLSGKYDIEKARPIDQKDLTASGDKVETTKLDLMKKDYIRLIKDGVKKVVGDTGGLIDIPESPKFTKDEFLYLFASKLIPDYERLSEKNKKSKLNALDNLYTHRFYNKWFKNNVDEGAFDKYQKDLMDIELDRNINVNDMNFSTAYAQLDDPMVRKVKGSTLRSMMSDTTGNDIVR